MDSHAPRAPQARTFHLCARQTHAWMLQMWTPVLAKPVVLMQDKRAPRVVEFLAAGGHLPKDQLGGLCRQEIVDISEANQGRLGDERKKRLTSGAQRSLREWRDLTASLSRSVRIIVALPRIKRSSRATWQAVRGLSPVIITT